MNEDELGRDFWKGFGLSQSPNFDKKSVLEIGSGKGARAFEAAASGASRVVGIDPSHVDTQISREQATRRGVSNRVTFIEGFIKDLPDETFDVILSENTLEHVLDVSGLLAEARNRLNQGGLCYFGFGPLYHAPDGDHGWLRETLPGWPKFNWPWGHLLFYSYALKKIGRLRGCEVVDTKNWPHLDLNKYSVEDYRRIFSESGMEVVYWRTNYVKSWKGKLLRAASRISSLEKYCTLNVFVVLRNVQAVSDASPSTDRPSQAT